MTVQIAYARRPLARRSTIAGLTQLSSDQFEGYASLFGVADGAGDTVAPGAFAASLRRRGAGQVRMLYQHFSHAPIGVWEHISEDEKGLFVRGRLSAEVEQARDIAALLRDGALCGCSTPPPAALPLILSAPPSPPPALMTPPRTLHCLRLSPCLPKIWVRPARTPIS